MAVVLLFLILGVLIAWKTWLPTGVLRQSSRMMTLGVFFLLLTMGVRIGADRATLRQLGAYGLQAFLFAVFTIAASLAAVALFEHLFLRGPIFKEGPDLTVNVTVNPYRMTVLIIAALLTGILLGFSIFPASAEKYLILSTNAALYFTLFSVGLDLGCSRGLWLNILNLGWHVLLAPLGVALASVVTGMAVGKLLGWTWLEGGAVGAGFGWYSLSGVLITQLHSVALGTVAFLSNVFREVLSVLLVPLLARRVSALALVAPGGATTMDTTLPLLASVGPPGEAVIALVNGISLSALVPVLVPLLLRK